MGDDHLISLQPGTVIAGRYEVVKSLGAGSMGVVYACRHRDLAGRLVSVKVLFPEVAQDKVAAARFRNEICASYGVSHPNVVRAYEYLTDGDLVAYTMEYVSGGDLADLLDDSDEQLPIPDIVTILSQMCSGVQAIHDAGIIHRDLKPENILISKDGMVKITDFGIARVDHGPKLTEHGGVVGTIDYVSPEYMLHSQVDWRSDIYAIGILAYEMVVGEAPFRGDSVYATMTKRLQTDPTPPSVSRSDCPPELDAIILRAMHRERDQRYQSAEAICHDLGQAFPKWIKRLVGDPLVVGDGVGSSKPAKTSCPLPSVRPAVPEVETEVERLFEAGLQNDSSGNASIGKGLQTSFPTGANHSTDWSASTGVDRPKVSIPTSGAFGENTANSPFSPKPSTSRGNPNSGKEAASVTDTLSTNDTVYSPWGGAVSSRNTSGGGSLGLTKVAEFPSPSSVTGTREIKAPQINNNFGAGASVSPPRNVPASVEVSSNLPSIRSSRLSVDEPEPAQREVWLDTLIFFLAVVVGVGIGFFLLRAYRPDLLGVEPGFDDSLVVSRRLVE